MISSKSAVPRNCSEGTDAPETIRLSAVSTPTSRGSRCVPPAPGKRPSFTSGSAICAPGEATRKWQPSASSRPPPIATPWMAAMTGFCPCSMAAMTVISIGSAVSWGVLNSRMSAPPEKALPAPMSTTALTSSSAAARSSPASMPLRNSYPRPLMGGLLRVMTATAPSLA